MSAPTLSSGARYALLFAAIGGLLFDGVELGLMPVASLSVSQSLLGDSYTPTLGGDWFARFTAALMLGAAVGGIFLGSLGDRIGRTRALGVSVLYVKCAAAVTKLQVLPMSSLYLSVGERCPLQVEGLFSDGVRRNISAAASGTAYGTGKATVATVSAQRRR